MVNGSRAKIRRGQAVKVIFRRSKILTPVAALDTAPMGVTPPCRRHRVLQLQARLVTSSLVRTFPGPSGYEVKSQGAILEATCKHVEVAKSVSPAGMASPHRNLMDFNITETPTKAKGTMRLIAPYPHALKLCGDSG